MKSILLTILTVVVTALLNVQPVKSECTIGAVGPLPAMDCKGIWCQSSYSYAGCGAGNGNTCSDAKNCPKEPKSLA